MTTRLMTARLQPLASRGLALGILVLLAGLIYTALIAPLIEDYAATQQQIVQYTVLAERYRRLAEALPSRRAALAALKQGAAGETGLLTSANETLAGAELQSRIKSIVEAAQGELKSTQVLPVQREGDFRRVGVRTEMSMTLPAAQRVLYQIESMPPWLFIDNLDIHSHAAERRQDRNTDIIVLEMSFEVSGYMRGQN
jgi:hypothetical protein